MRNLAAALASCVLCALLSLVLATGAVRAELKPINPFAATEVAPGPPSAFAPRPVAVPFQATGPLGRLFAWVLDKQQGLQRMLATSVKGLKTDNPMTGALTLAGLSFLYGILHAVGPGHGKTIISSYVVANEETARRGVIISFIAAGLQALTAVVLVGLLLFGLNASGLQVNAWSNQLESVSYAMIALVGLYLLTTQLLRLFRNWRGVPAAYAAHEQPAHSHAKHHSQNHDHHAIHHSRAHHDHDHHDHGHDHQPSSRAGRGMRSYRRCAATRRPLLLAKSHGGGVLGRHQALHRGDPGARLCRNARRLLGRGRRNLRHGARHRHYGRRARNACTRIARAGTQTWRWQCSMDRSGMDRVRHRRRSDHLPVRPALVPRLLGSDPPLLSPSRDC